MFDKNFYPTPQNVIDIMTKDLKITGKVFLEPSCGKGDIVDFLNDNGAKSVLGCELNNDLRTISESKCKVIANDFFTVTSDMISHINGIVMNPPFDNADKHILHAYEIAPNGCEIVALCNFETLQNLHTKTRKELFSIIDKTGTFENLGDCFSESERKTGVIVGLIKIKKEGEPITCEFEGFFMDDDPVEYQENGLITYNFVRDLVNRYVNAVKIYDNQLNEAVKMNNLLKGFYHSNLSMSITEEGKPKSKEEFKKDLQRSGWKFIFSKMDLDKYSTQKLKDELNLFIETQTKIPFTMKNIYAMLNIIIGTASQRMDKSLVDVFDRITGHHHENRLNIEGWQTNSEYMVNRKFILPYISKVGYSGNLETEWSGRNIDIIEDFNKALCYLTGEEYNKIGNLYSFCRNRFKIITNKVIYTDEETHNHKPSVQSITKNLYENGIKYNIIDCTPKFGEWFEFGFFRCKGYKKGSMHFEFIEEKVQDLFNNKIAEIKGFPLILPKKKTNWQQKQK